MSPALSTTFRSLRVRNYRYYAAGQVVSNSGTWAQRVAQDWLVLELSGDNGTALGITTGLQFTPVLLFGLYGGLLADRYDKRRLLMGAQAVMGLLALLLAVLDLTGAVRLWHVYALAFALGLASVVDTPVRQSFVSEIVGPDDLPNAVSLNSATFNSARIIGPAVAGVAIASVGTGVVFLGNAVSYLAVLAGLLAMRPAELFPAKRSPRASGQTREGLAYVRSRPDLLVPIVLVGLVGMFGLNFQITLALVAKEVFGRGAGSYALLTTALALGSLLGALGTARRVGLPQQRRVFLAGLAFGLLEVAVGLAPTYAVMAVLLVPTGLAVLTFTTTANTSLQLRVDPHVRGRVMALYVLVFLGGTPLGAPVVGAFAEQFGARAAIVLGGVVTALSAVVAAAWLARTRHLSVRAHVLRRHPHVHVRPLPAATVVEHRRSAPGPGSEADGQPGRAEVTAATTAG